MEQIYIKNISGSVFKIPFKLNTPYEIKAKVRGIIDAGKRKLIPADVALWLDMERLKAFEDHKEIKVTRRQVRVPRVAIKPMLKANTVLKPKDSKPDKAKVTKSEKVEKGGS